jgi:hypothetical protein
MTEPQLVPVAKVTPTNFIEPIRCSKCNDAAYVIRRTMDPKQDGSEVWSFHCVNGHYTERSGQR